MKIGVCLLCQEEKDLIKKSHIIPKALMKNSVNKERDGFVRLNPKTQNKRRVFDDCYEPHILCLNCDGNIIGAFDDYFCKFIYGSLGRYEQLLIGSYKDYSLVKNIRAEKMQLFCLSFLWRCSISNHGSFKHVQLSAERNEELRNMILNRATLFEKYPVLIWSYGHHKEIPQDIIFPPFITNTDKRGIRSFLFIGLGLMIQIIIENDTLDDFSKEAMLTENGEMKIPNMPIEVVKPMLNDFFGWDWL